MFEKVPVNLAQPMFITLSLRIVKNSFSALDADITQLFTVLVFLAMKLGFQTRSRFNNKQLS